ncbi:nuclear transport factor 2 family protein [Streptomyces sp. NPDC003758]|uniref:Nuclear transport factor 2 family protein n=1 Tax=Streptomyces cynarae TaxID=2981134 RepID=A0ABY6E457_9ACTN|nr:nuclear transport factor 2 family protein [Streptomyces cynarae]UXY21359.1 nuclear transport factor 2 family protein [Streptomyces cynarae]
MPSGACRGLNRVPAELPDGTPVESWSRATRVFRKRNGTWPMIHQHMSGSNVRRGRSADSRSVGHRTGIPRPWCLAGSRLRRWQS